MRLVSSRDSIDSAYVYPYSRTPAKALSPTATAGLAATRVPAGFGVYIQDSAGKVLAELSQFLGTHTNNFAEYSALLAALEFAIANGHKSLRVVSDSELMVKQIKGQYRVNSPELRPLYERGQAPYCAA